MTGTAPSLVATTGDDDKVLANYDEYLDLYKDQAKKQQIQLNSGGADVPEAINSYVV